MKKSYILAGLLLLLFTQGLMAQYPDNTTVPLGNVRFAWPEYAGFTGSNNYYVVTLGTATDQLTTRLETPHADNPVEFVDFALPLTPNQQFYWRLEIWRNGIFLSEFPQIPLDPWDFISGTFQNVSPANGATVPSGQVDFDWDDFGFEKDGTAEDDTMNIVIYLDAAGSNPVMTQLLPSTTSQTKVLTMLLPPSTYYWRVFAQDDGVRVLGTDIWAFTVATGPEIDVTGNGAAVNDNSTTPTLANDTDFGNVAVAGGTNANTFTLTNSGTEALTLSGTPVVVISGTDAADFQLTTDATGPVTASGNTAFTITFDPSAAGTRTATVSIVSNDSDENPYNFAIQGTGAVYPEMDVQGNGISITDADATPSTADDTDFGATGLTGGTVDKTFTISNSGDGALSLNGTPQVVIGGTHVAAFNVTVHPAASVPSGGGTTTFTVQFDPSVIGLHTATVSIANDDADENPYNFSIQGTGGEPEIDVEWPDDTDIADMDTVNYGHHLIGPDTLTLYFDNVGSDILHISGITATELTQVSAVHSVTTLPMNIPAAGSDSIAIAFNIDAADAFSFDLDIASDDSNESPYDIHIIGTGTAPEIDVRANGTVIADGGNYDFEDQGTGRSKEASFHIRNTGSSTLTLTLPHTISGADAVHFAISSSDTNTVVAPGDSANINIMFRPKSSGHKTATFSIVSDDADENPYNITLMGRGIKHPFTIYARPEGAGTTDPAPSTYLYEKGTIIPITAIPADGYRFVRWDGHDIADPNSASTTITIYWQNHAVAYFESTSDPVAPYLCYAFPVDSADFVPQNARIQFRTGDSSKGVDLITLNAWVDNTPIITDGIDQTGGQVAIRQELTEYSVIYTPETPFEEDSTVTVRVLFNDASITPLTCDSTWSFKVGTTCVDTSTISYTWVGELGGTVTNEDLGIGMTIPTGALTDTLQIVISRIDSLPALPEGTTGIGLHYHFGPDGLTLNAPVRVSIPYTLADLDSAGVSSAADLTINYFHSASGEWTQLTVDHVDQINQLIFVEIDQFCILTFTRGTTSVSEGADPSTAPQAFTLHQNFPNPFNPQTAIAYELAESGPVTLKIFDIKGRLIKTLIDGILCSGAHSAIWQADNTHGKRVPSGLYIYQLKAGNIIQQKKMLLLK